MLAEQGDVGLTEADVCLQFQWEEEEAKKGLLAKHKVMPSAFLSECLDVEEMQCVLVLFSED